MGFGLPAGDPSITVPDGVWGIVCRLCGPEVDYSVPPGANVAASTPGVVGYIKRLAEELARLPHRYGYDPASVYTVVVQTWDRALSPIRSLALGREVGGQEQVGLIPDAYYLEAEGYADLHRFALRAPPWRRRSQDVAWRGSVTGRGSFASPAEVPRIRLALACRDLAGTNVALTGVHPTMMFPRPELDAFLQREHILAGSWPVRHFAYHRFVFDIDGHANAWGLIEKLILGCCVLKVQSPFEQWFYPRLHPWEHFVPIAADLSDLPDALRWCRANAARCEWIAANGARLAATLRLHDEVPRSCLELMKAATATPARETPAFRSAPSGPPPG